MTQRTSEPTTANLLGEWRSAERAVVEATEAAEAAERAALDADRAAEAAHRAADAARAALRAAQQDVTNAETEERILKDAAKHAGGRSDEAALARTRAEAVEERARGRFHDREREARRHADEDAHLD